MFSMLSPWFWMRVTLLNSNHFRLWEGTGAARVTLSLKTAAACIWTKGQSNGPTGIGNSSTPKPGST